MPNTIEVQTLNDGPRNLVVKIHIDGDGSGDETGALVVDVSGYNGAPTHVRVNEIHGTLSGFTAELLWYATAPIHMLNVPDYDVHHCFDKFGGLVNNAGSGKTGDITLKTTGLDLNDTGHIILEMVKQYEPSW